MKKLIITFIAIVVSAGSLYSQNKTIKGRVIDNNLEILPYMPIVINDTVVVGRTDLDGFFKVDIPVSVKKIVFSTVGIELASVGLVDTCDEVEVIMMLRCTCDFMTPKQVDRYRLKKFNKLPALHKEAFVKGIFKTEKACYRQEFMPDYKKKQK